MSDALTFGKDSKGTVLETNALMYPTLLDC
jgi:hypothetical protein